MPVTLPIDVYEEFEKGFGKEGARKVIKALEATISDATEFKWKTTKDELLDVIRREFITKEVFEERIEALRREVENARTDLEGRIENVRTDLEGRIENARTDLEGRIENYRISLESRIDKLNQKFNFMIVLLIIALTLMNPVVAEIIKGLL